MPQVAVSPQRAASRGRSSCSYLRCIAILLAGASLVLVLPELVRVISQPADFSTSQAARTVQAPDVADEEQVELFGCEAQVRKARLERCSGFTGDSPRPRILVTGGSGFIGGHLVRRLKRAGMKSVKVVDNLWRGRLNNLCDHTCKCVIDMSVDFCKMDLSDRNSFGTIFEHVDKVYHLADVLAGIGFVFQNEHWIYQQNGLINTNVLNAVLASQSVQNYVYVGSACSFPLELQSGYEPVALHENQTFPAHPESAYGWSKLMGEVEASLVMKMSPERRHDLSVSILRFHNVYGPNAQYANKKAAQALPALVKKAIDAEQVADLEIWGSGRQNRDFIYVDDIVSSLMLSDKGTNAGAIQIGTGVATTLLRSATIVQGLAKTCLGKELTLKTDESKMEGDLGRVATLERAKDILGWEPRVYIEEGLARLFEWVLLDMQHRGEGKPWMAKARECLVGEADRFAQQKIERTLPRRVPGGATVWELGKELQTKPQVQPTIQQL